MALSRCAKSSHMLLYLWNEGVNQSKDACDSAVLPNKYCFLTRLGKGIPGPCRAARWNKGLLLASHCLGLVTQAWSQYTSKKGKGVFFYSWGYHDSQQSMGKLFFKAVFCPLQVSSVNTKRLWSSLEIFSQWGQTDTLDVTKKYSVLVRRWPVWVLNAKTRCLTNNSQAMIFLSFSSKLWKVLKALWNWSKS